jgi:hypothetical protein
MNEEGEAQESELYPSVEAFVHNTLNCDFTFREAGKDRVGWVDIFGVRYMNVEKTEIEAIGVEVKGKTRSLSANFGQAKGYSVFCDKVYFASLNVNKEDIKIASFLGIGLVKIEGQHPNFVCSEILEAPTNKPIIEIRDYALEHKGVFQCESCKVFQPYKRNEYYETKKTWNEIEPYAKKEVEKNGKGLLIADKNNTHKFYCNKCAIAELKTKEEKR